MHIHISEARVSARNDALRFWRRQVAAIAAHIRDAHPTVRAFYRTSPAPAEFKVRGKGWPGGPLREIGPLEGAQNDEYDHNILRNMNDIGAAAFQSAGHGVIDVETMLGLRVDSHPASHSSTGEGDALHFCMPGVPDYALDYILRSIFSRN